MKKNRDTSDLILVAKVGKSKGLKGEFFLNSLCDPKENNTHVWGSGETCLDFSH